MRRATNQLQFTVICPNNTGGYCNSGIYAYRTPTQSGTAVSGPLPVGNVRTPQCHTTGTGSGADVNASPWGAKHSTEWIRFRYGSADVYFPWAWARLDGGDRLGMIPHC